MKIRFIYKYTLLFCACFLGLNALHAQTVVESSSLKRKFTEVKNEVSENSKYKVLEDTTAVLKFTNPDNIGLGLPMSIMGMNLVRNGLAVSPYIYPLIPLKVWSPDSGLIGGGENSMGTTAVEYGMGGYTMSVEDNFGIPINRTILTLMANDRGFLNPMVTSAGEIGNSLTMYSVTVKGLLDPGAFSTPFSTYWKEQNFGARFALSKIYKRGGILGRAGLLYAYHESKGHTFNTKIPFMYEADGSTYAPNNMVLGRSSYLESSGVVHSFNPFTGETDSVDVMGPKFTSHNIDFVNNTFFTNGWSWNTNLRYMYAKGGLIANNPVAPLDATPGRYTYLDGTTDYTRDGVFLGAFGYNYETPFQVLAAKSSLEKILGDHKMRLTLSEYFFNIDQFVGTSTFYFEGIETNPTKLKPKNGWADIIMDANGNLPVADNTRLEYIDGSENKAALVLSETYEPNNRLLINAAVRLELHTLSGLYAPLRTPARANNRLYSEHFKRIQKTTDLNKSFNTNAIWKIHSAMDENKKGDLRVYEYGVLAGGGMLERGHDLTAYFNGTPFEDKVNRIWNLELGAFYKKSDISVISKFFYVNNINHMETPGSNIIAPYNPFITGLIQPVHDIQTIAWASKVLIESVKGLKIDLGLTLQSSKYKNFSGDITFSDANTLHFNYNNKYVPGLSCAVVDFRARYLFPDGKYKVWGSLQYKSKPYANKSNLIQFASQYDTALGFAYFPVHFLAIDLSFKNLLNKVYPIGSMSYTDLMDQDQINKRVINKPIIAEYTMPFTANLLVTYIF